MIVLAREVFLCKCSTETTELDSLVRATPLTFVLGGSAHMGLLDRQHHGPARCSEFGARLARGERWLVGLVGERVATYTWLHTRPSCAYPYLRGCEFILPVRYAYGYDAWTAPDLRGLGYRLRAFHFELGVLKACGKAWEASFFIASQLAGAQRSLSRAAIDVVPLWRVALGPKRSVVAEELQPQSDVLPASSLVVRTRGV